MLSVLNSFAVWCVAASFAFGGVVVFRIWSGCNECTVVTSDPESETAVYATFVMTTVADEDKSRIVWPSCPADGWSSGE